MLEPVGYSSVVQGMDVSLSLCSSSHLFDSQRVERNDVGVLPVGGRTPLFLDVEFVTEVSTLSSINSSRKCRYLPFVFQIERKLKGVGEGSFPDSVVLLQQGEFGSRGAVLCNPCLS